MIVIGDTVISDDVVEKLFVCNIEKCKGACCIEGDLGAPLEAEELEIMHQIYEKVKPYLSKEGITEIERQGVYIKDVEGDFSTPTIQNNECAYAIYDDKGHLQCGIEQAYNDGKIDFKKPLSCHLYPIRIKEYGQYDAVNYDRWSICRDACVLGNELGVPVYQFVKDALIRKYGEEWYKLLVVEAKKQQPKS